MFKRKNEREARCKYQPFRKMLLDFSLFPFRFSLPTAPAFFTFFPFYLFTFKNPFYL